MSKAPKRRMMTVALGVAVLPTALLAAGCSNNNKSDSGSGSTGTNSNASATNSSGSGGAVTLKDGSGVKVALVPGGPHPYFQPWKQAGQKAKASFGLGGISFNETSQWDQGKQNSLLDSLAAQGDNAFGIFGVSPADINSTFQNLKSKGFAVASLASCPAGNTDEADFCLSTDVQLAAYRAAKTAIQAMGGKGVLVHLTGNNTDSNTKRREAGVRKAVSEAGGKVKLLQTITDIDVDLQSAQKAVGDLLAAHGKQIDGIVTTAYNPAVAAAEGVKKAGLPIKVIAIDDDPKILQGIKDGNVTATVTQNPYGQAYIGSWALALLQTKQCTMRQPGQIIDSGSFVVTKSNVDTYDQERQAKTKELQKQFATSVLNCS
ncbi:MAG TPA: sugar ABC transporter substrate-binding protein [Thermoleophilaceae bacterium]|jgi:ribose transport system substrate-binding protein|nr:sugar ABC transporter substrate-binding protein [Thermoleophilaceae bacterium]